MFQKSWLSAEALLAKAKTWTFIGYSLPAADYEFKYLLKRTQLARTEKPELVLITGGDKAEETYRNYQTFFGRGIRNSGPVRTCFDSGLKGEAITYLRRLGALKG